MNRTTKNIILNMLMLLIIVVFVVFVIYAKQKRNDFKPKSISINIDELEDNYLISKDDIYYLVTKYFTLNNQAIDDNTLRSIEKTICNIPVVKSANAYINNQGILNIDVKQRKPLFRVYNSSNQNFYVDYDGVKFFPKKNTSIKVPIVTGNISEKKVNNDTIQTAILNQVLNFCKYTQKVDEWKDSFGQININDANEIELIPRIGNSTILLGNTDVIEEKMNKLKVFYTEVLDKIGWERYRVINIMYKDQIICLK